MARFEDLDLTEPEDRQQQLAEQRSRVDEALEYASDHPFLLSILDQLHRGRLLSEKQIETLERFEAHNRRREAGDHDSGSFGPRWSRRYEGR